jgi:hypothetical protein
MSQAALAAIEAAHGEPPAAVRRVRPTAAGVEEAITDTVAEQMRIFGSAGQGMMERKGIIAAGNMLVDHVHQIVQWPERGWLAGNHPQRTLNRRRAAQCPADTGKNARACRCRRWG